MATPDEVFARRLRLALLAAFLVAAGLFLYAVRRVLVPFVLAAVIAYLLDPAVRALVRRGVPRGWAIAAVYAAVLGALAGLVVFLIPVVAEQLNRLATTLPELVRETDAAIDRLQARYRGVALPPGFRQAVDENVARLEEQGVALIEGAVGALIGAVRGVVIVLFAIVLAFYLLLDLERLKARAAAFVPTRQRAELAGLVARVDGVLGGFIRGQVVVALAVGGLTALVMALLGLRFWALLGIVAALTEFIPYFGPVLGALPAVALALLDSPWLALKVAVAYVVIQQVESAIIAPRIVGPWVGLHPLAVIFAVLSGGQLFGIWGLLLAIPVTAVVRVLGEFAYEQLVPEVPLEAGPKPDPCLMGTQPGSAPGRPPPGRQAGHLRNAGLGRRPVAGRLPARRLVLPRGGKAGLRRPGRRADARGPGRDAECPDPRAGPPDVRQGENGGEEMRDHRQNRPR